MTESKYLFWLQLFFCKGYTYIKDRMKYSPPCFENIIYEKPNLQLPNIFKMNTGKYIYEEWDETK